ncbi:helix-turn-helix domain-containing protein [Streptomyces sp. PR69]|uniref:helix-turn-helix domain-containing protein n=1 Tax=Streptomyces sp. PR69 TaxID=2984950 RepID=UPI002263ACFF|nr:helix-turn-helix transcriptional regulator [Streptomyces sp. PR69]
MDQDMARLGAALKASRVARRPKMTQEDAATALGVSRATVQNIERGSRPSKVNSTIREYAALLGWSKGSVERVLAGDEPVLVQDSPGDAAQPSPAPAEDELPVPPLIRAELRKGQVLASGVFDLTPEGSTAQLIVVVKGPNDATDEDMRRYAAAWRQTQRKLRELESSETDDES